MRTMNGTRVTTLGSLSINERNYPRKLQEIENEINDMNATMHQLDEIHDGELIHDDPSIEIATEVDLYDNKRQIEADEVVDSMRDERDFHRKELAKARRKINNLRRELNQNQEP